MAKALLRRKEESTSCPSCGSNEYAGASANAHLRKSNAAALEIERLGRRIEELRVEAIAHWNRYREMGGSHQRNGRKACECDGVPR